jgi:hypothetical protein
MKMKEKIEKISELIKNLDTERMRLCHLEIELKRPLVGITVKKMNNITQYYQEGHGLFDIVQKTITRKVTSNIIKAKKDIQEIETQLEELIV